MRPLVAALAIALLPSVGSAQATPRAIPDELAGYRLGAPRSTLPPGTPCHPPPTPSPGQTGRPYIMRCFSDGPVAVFIRADTIAGIVWVRSGNVTAQLSRDDAWTRYALPQAARLYGPPDSIVQDSVFHATVGLWNGGGRRRLQVSVTVSPQGTSGTAYTVRTQLACTVTEGDWVAACLQGDRP